MRSKFLRRTAIAVSMSAFALSGVASADQQYSSPSRWNNFRPALDEALAAEDAAVNAADDLLGGSVEDLPGPSLAAPRRESIQQGSMSRDMMKDNLPPRSYQPAQQSVPQASRDDSMHKDHSMSGPAMGQPHYSGGYPPASYSDQPQYSTAPSNQSAPSQMGSYNTMPTPVGSGHINGGHINGGHMNGGHMNGGHVGSGHVSSGSDCQSCQGGSDHAYSSSPYAQAMSSPWEGGSSQGGEFCGAGASGAGIAAGRPSLSPYFGSGGVLIYNLEEGSGRRIATGLNKPFFTSDLNPGTTAGYDAQIGRYLKCGQYAIGARYWQWNPGKESITRFATGPQSIRAAQPRYRDAFLNFDPATTGPERVYDHIDGASATSDGAYQVRMTRDLNFYGVEVNLFKFGLMGASRAAYSGCGTGGCGLGGGHGYGNGYGRNRGLGGAAGPLVRATSGRLRVANSSGIRYLRITDETNTAYGIDLNATATDPGGPTRVTIFDDFDTENELLGYQFGSTLTYCLGNRWDLNIGGKFGIYGNRATTKHRLGTDTQVAYLTAGGTDDINTKSSDTVLSTLGELDLGLGYRATRGWTLRGGYRIFGVTGVANAIDSQTVAYSSIPDIARVRANSSYILQGAYVGGQYNW